MVVHYRNDSFSRVFAVRHRQLDIPVRLYQNHSQSLTVIGVSPAFTVADYIIGAGTMFGSGVINPKVSGVHDQIQPEKKKPVPLLSANLYTGKCQQPSGKDKQ